MDLLLYCRVSTEDQNVEQQVKFCKEWALRNKHYIVWTIQDKESGTLPLIERKKFKKIINNEFNFEYEGVLIYKLDRLTRNWDDVTAIERYFRENWEDIKLISTSDSIDFSNASGRMMFRIMMAVCCNMPEDMKEKQKIGIERAKAEGKYKGGKRGRRWKEQKR